VRWSLSAIVLLAATGVAAAAASIPSSELPGRDRQRFQEQPLDRFTQPQSKRQPLWRWDCEQPKAKRKGKRAKRRKDC
jgi:hypothetical protein